MAKLGLNKMNFSFCVNYAMLDIAQTVTIQTQSCIECIIECIALNNTK